MRSLQARKQSSLSLLVALSLIAIFAPQAQADLLVRLRQTLNPTQTQAVTNTLDSFGAKIVTRYSSVPGLVQVYLPDSAQPAQVRAALMKLGTVTYAVPDRVRQAAAVSTTARAPRRKAGDAPEIPAPTPAPAKWEDDPQEALQYGVEQTGAAQVWRSKGAIGGPATAIAILDSGVDYTHPDLTGNLWRNGDEIGYDFVNGAPRPWDDDGHGTHVAGIVAAVGGNGLGIAGQCPRCSVMAIKVLDAKGATRDSIVLKGLDYALAKGAKIIVLAWGGPDESQALFDGLKAASDSGALLVAAAGNDGADLAFAPYYPAKYKLPGMISVAGLYDSPPSMPFWTNYGKPFVHLSGAGAEVHSTWPGDKLVMLSGTSMAAAQIAGAAALIKSYRPKLKATEIVELLKTVTPDTDSATRTVFGGRPDLVRIFSKL